MPLYTVTTRIGAFDNDASDRSSAAREEAIVQPATRQRSEPVLLAWQARRVQDYINANLGQTIRVVDLSRETRKTEAHFSRAFRNTFGLAPHAYLIQRRIELATCLIRTTTVSLTEIALKCGFTDQAHLCKRFRQYMGTTPSAWRRTHSNPIPLLHPHSGDGARARS